MREIKLWVFNKIVNYLGLDKIEKEIAINRSEIDFHKQFLKVGLDVNIREPSWAVVCIGGKPDYVQFVNLNKSDALEIKKFLRHFDRKNVVVDNPFFKY